MINRFVLGLAQADKAYGLGKKKNFSEVINLSLKNDFKYFDTSKKYKNSSIYEKRILKNRNTKLITKSSFNYPLDSLFGKNVEKEIKNIIKKTNKKIYAFLIHDPLLPLSKHKWNIIIKILKKYKKKGFLNKIGISVYSRYELDLILKIFTPDIIQFPINLFNQSFSDEKYLKSLKKKNIELHGRSVFLQGLLLKNNKDLNNYFNMWEDQFKNLQVFLKNNKLSKLDACLNYVTQIRYIDRITIGIDNKNQFYQILRYINKLKNKNKKINFSILKSDDDNLIDPRYWKLKKRNLENLKKWINVKKIVLNGGLLLSKRPEQFLPGGWPTFYKKAKSCLVWDNSNKKYIDFSYMGVGTNILGYSHKKINEYVKKIIDQGSISTLNSNLDNKLSKELIKAHSWAGMTTFCRTGAEANTLAIRISRVFTKKDQIAICGYHGWHDWYLSANLENKNNLDSIHLKGLSTIGVPDNLRGTIHPFKYNDIKSFKNLINRNPNIGTVFMEVQRNEKPKRDFLKIIRKITLKKDILLIFDECTSGFREVYGGLHKKYKVYPDIAVFGKALGNGIPITAVIGKKNVMEKSKKSFISSTFWTDSTGPAAAIATLEEMKKVKSWKKTVLIGKKIKKFWKSLSKKYNIELNISGLDSMPTFNFKNKLNLYFKTFITQELLKKNILATNTVYCCIDHEKYLHKYFKELDIVFKKIKFIINNESILDYLDYPVSNPGFSRLN